MKQEVARNYLAATKARHQHKINPSLHIVAVNGVKPNNIGGAVADYIMMTGNRVVDFSHQDVRHGVVLSDLSGITDLVVCSGHMSLNWFEDESEEEFRRIFDTNITGAYLAAQKFVRATINGKFRCRIIFIGSMAYNHVLNGSAAYCASKAALAMLTRCLAWELAPKGYDVFCVHPSNTEHTPMAEKTITELMRFRNLDRAAAEAYWGANLPTQAWLQPGDVAKVVHSLITNQLPYASGSNIELAGGQR